MAQRIAVIGTGRMGGAIGKRLAQIGYNVILGSRNPDSDHVKELLSDIGNGAKAMMVNEVKEMADQIVIATPYHALRSTLNELGGLSGKLIIDVTNALKMGSDGLMEMASDTSSGEEIQAANQDAKIVKALNTIGFHMIANPAAAPGPVGSAIAGNDDGSKKVVSELIQKMGFETIDVGPIRQSRYLEGMSALYLTPYLQGRMNEAFEYYFRTGSSPKESKGVRSAG